MPRIKAFKAWRPAPDKVLSVIAKPFDQFYTEQAKEILRNNPCSFLHTIEPLIDNPFQRGSREDVIFKRAKEFFDEFKEEGVLLQDEQPSIYIYKTLNQGKWQTGIWCITAIDDYLDNTLRKHEHTRADREKDLIEYLDNTGIDANPVLVTYHSSDAIKSLLKEITAVDPLFDFYADGQQHQLWKVDQESKLNLLIEEFKALPASYIADGHHRAAAASIAGIQRRKNNLRHRGTEEYNFFSTLYFDFEELMVFEFQRVVADLNNFSTEEFLSALQHIFELSEGMPGKPIAPNQYNMYLDGKWYLLKIPAVLLEQGGPVDLLDVSILQDKVLGPLLQITDPRRDKRIQFIGGLKPVDEIVSMVDAGIMKVAFFLFPTSIKELVDVADSGNVMPPKSTWFEPKLHCGLVVHEVR